MLKVAEAMDMHSDIVWLFTTQENREGAEDKTKMPNPLPRNVYGADAVAQQCSDLIHVFTWDVPEVFGAGGLSMLTLTLGRDSGGGGEHRRFFVHMGFSEFYTPLDFEEGTRLAYAIMNMLKAQEEKLKAEAEQMAKAGDARATRKAGQRPPSVTEEAERAAKRQQGSRNARRR